MVSPYLSSIKVARKHMESGDSIAAAEAYLVAYDLKLQSGDVDDLEFIENQIRTLVPDLPIPAVETPVASSKKTRRSAGISDVDYASEFIPEEHDGDFSRVAGMI